MAVFVVEVFVGAGREGFVVLVGDEQGFVVGYGRRERFSGGERGTKGSALGGGFSCAEGESAAVKVVATLASLFSLRSRRGGGVRISFDGGGLRGWCRVLKGRRVVGE